MIYENTHPDYFCLWNYPGRPKMPMIQTLPRSKLWCVYVLVQKRLWKNLYRQKCDMIQTLARSIYEKTQKNRKSLWSRVWIVQFMKRLELRNTDKNWRCLSSLPLYVMVLHFVVLVLYFCFFLGSGLSGTCLCLFSYQSLCFFLGLQRKTRLKCGQFFLQFEIVRGITKKLDTFIIFLKKGL